MPTPRTVLIVDDDNGVRKAIDRFLRASDYNVISAANPQEALQKLDAAPKSVDVMVTDYDMKSDMNGIELIGAVRKRGLEMPAILLSANIDEESRPGFERQLKSAGGRNGLLPKPVRGDDLVALMESLLSQSRSIAP